MEKNIVQLIESLLFVSPKPLNMKRLIELTHATKNDITEALQVIAEYYRGERGIWLLEQEGEYQFGTAPSSREAAEAFVKEHLNSELTRPSLETLTIIAYRGPVSKVEIELIRGVNCSLILRNLLMRGLIQEEEDKKTLQTFYSVTIDFLRHLGIQKISELPEYEKFHDHEDLKKILGTAGHEKTVGMKQDL